MKNLHSLFAISLLSAAISVSAQAATPYSNFVVFGDSLSDAGQFPDAGGPAGATTRFTNRVGPTYQMGSGEVIGASSPVLLGRSLGFSDTVLGPSTSQVYADNGWEDGANWATGGYRTDQILNSITAANGSATGFRTRNGYLFDRGFQADADALYYVNGGGNDFLQGKVLSTADAQAAAGRLADSVRALQQAGARYFMVPLLPNVGNTPAISSNAGASALFASLGADVNVELVKQLAGINAEIVPLNTPLMLAEVLQDPASFGFDASQNLIGTCFDGCATENATWGVNSATPDPSKLIFNDSVHPTTAVQRIFADYAYSLLAAPWELTLLPEMALGNLRAHQDQMQMQWQADRDDWQVIGEWRGFVNAGGQYQEYDLYSNDADGDGYNLNVGGSYRLNDAWRMGLAAGFYQQELEAGTADSEYELYSYLATAFAEYQAEHLWADMSLSAGYLDYSDLNRKLMLGMKTRSEKGDTSGDLWSLTARLGYDVASVQSRWHLSPFLSVDYAQVNIDGYSESGQSATALSFDDQERSSQRLGIGLQGSFDFTQQTRVFAEVFTAQELESDTSNVTMSLSSVSDLQFTLEGFEPGESVSHASVGVRHEWRDGLSLAGNYLYRTSDESDQQALNISLSWGF